MQPIKIGCACGVRSLAVPVETRNRELPRRRC